MLPRQGEGGPILSRDEQAQLHASNGRHYGRVLARVSDMVNGSIDTFTIIRQIMHEAATLFSAERAMVLLYESDDDLTYLLGSGFTPEQARTLEETACEESSARYLAGITSPAIISTRARDDGGSGLSDWAASVGASTLMLAPLVHTSELLGFLVLGHRDSRDYSEEDLLALRTLCNLMALTVGSYRSASTEQEVGGGKDRFLSALSHELRTPLTSIMGFTQIIRRRLSASGAGDARLMDQLEVLWTQAQRLSRLIDTFVDISNVERGEFALNLGKVELVSVLKKAVDQSLAQDRHHHQIMMDTASGPVWVHGDGKRLEQVFNHVLSNALRYSPQDKPVVVALDERRSHGKVLVSITDYGPGIPSDRLKTIFERFHEKDVLKAGGLGVGLYISKMILEAHGGHISIESTQGRGTVVSLTLPA